MITKNNISGFTLCSKVIKMIKKTALLLLVLFMQIVQAKKTENKMENTVKNGQDELFTIIYPNKDKETIILLHRGPEFPSDMDKYLERPS